MTCCCDLFFACFFPPTGDKTCEIYMFRRCCQEGEKYTLWLLFQWLTSINMNRVTRYVVFHMALVKSQLHHTPPALFGAWGTLPLRNTLIHIYSTNPLLCCSSTWAFNTSITLQSASNSNFSHSKQSIIFPYCPLKYVSATTSKKVKVLVILLICLSHWKCYSCSNGDDDFEELSLLNIFQAIKHLQHPVSSIFLNRIANNPSSWVSIIIS